MEQSIAHFTYEQEKLISAVIELLTRGQKVVIQNRRFLNLEPLFERIRDSLLVLERRGIINHATYCEALMNLTSSEVPFLQDKCENSSTVVITMDVVATLGLR